MMTHRIIKGEILNATSSGQMWANLASAAMAAHNKMREAGAENFSVKVEEEDGGYTLRRVAMNAFANFMRIASDLGARRVKPESMTEEEKLAVCVASRVPLVTENSGALMIKVRTRYPCAISLEDYGYRVSVLKELDSNICRVCGNAEPNENGVCRACEKDFEELSCKPPEINRINAP